MTTFNVSNASSLLTAVRSARPGDTILLASGDYGAVRIDGAQFAGEVTIAAANYAAPPVFQSLMVLNTRGITFSGIEMEVQPGVAGVFVNYSSDLRFESMDLHGVLDGVPTSDGGGFAVRNSTNITITQSEFHDLAGGISHLSVRGLTITDNFMHTLRTDGIAGSGSHDILIARNEFTDFWPAPTDHPDAIQFWSNVAGPTRNVTIEDNVFIRGDGLKIQGIFMHDEGLTGYDGLVIRGNAIIGGMYNGIWVNNARNAVISDNIVQGFSDMESYMHIYTPTTLTMDGNFANEFHLYGSIANTNATMVAQATDGGAWALQQWETLQGEAPAPIVPPTAPAGLSLVGTAGAEALTGAALDDVLRGLGGSDTLLGGAGSDSLEGGDGNDRLDGGAGADRLVGGSGSDVFIVNNTGDFVFESAAGGDDMVWASVSSTLAANVEDGGLLGSANLNLTGNELSNHLSGNTGANLLSGGAGADSLSGSWGNDTLAGGAGADRLGGGGGADRFVLVRGQARGDVIDDFARGDRLELSGYSPGSTIVRMAGSSTDWLVRDAATGTTEVIKLANAYVLGGGDYLFV